MHHRGLQFFVPDARLFVSGCSHYFLSSWCHSDLVCKTMAKVTNMLTMMNIKKTRLVVVMAMIMTRIIIGASSVMLGLSRSQDGEGKRDHHCRRHHHHRHHHRHRYCHRYHHRHQHHCSAAAQQHSTPHKSSSKEQVADGVLRAIQK